MRTTIAASLLVLASATASCGSDAEQSSATGAADCQQGLRYDGVVYVEVGFLEQEGAGALGEAVLAECDDQGEDPSGIVFPEDAPNVEVVQVEGAEPAEAVGRATDDGLQVFVSETLGDQERERVRAALGLE
jgi:hypothetical protein